MLRSTPFRVLVTRTNLVRLVLPALVFAFGSDEANAANEPTATQQITSVAKLAADIDQAVRATMAEQDLPGAAVVVVQKGKTILKRGYGVANVQRKTPVDPDKTLFRIGSISKALTLLTLTRLADKGQVNLTDDVTEHFGEIKNPKRFPNPITIENLMTHTTGLDQIGLDRQVRDFNRPLAERKAMRPSLMEFLNANNLRRTSAPGQYYRYDTYGTTLAGAVIERVTGKPYAEAMHNQMFAPLGMSRTFVEADEKHIGDLATGYERVGNRNLAEPYEIYMTTPASSIDSTVADMGRLLEALTGGGANEHGRLFRAKTAAAVLAPQYRPHPEFFGTTHGLHESADASGEFEIAIRSVEHGGTMAGFKTLMAILPKYNVGVFVVTNRSGGGRNPLAAAVMRTVVANLPDVPTRKPYKVPARNKNQNLDKYAGTYCYAMYCHSCSPAEFARGGWARNTPRVITAKDGSIRLGNDEYIPRLPVAEGIFVRTDGLRMLYFGGDKAGKPTFFVYSSSNDAFERVGD